jgi:hypothetical protein
MNSAVSILGQVTQRIATAVRNIPTLEEADIEDTVNIADEIGFLGDGL